MMESTRTVREYETGARGGGGGGGDGEGLQAGNLHAECRGYEYVSTPYCMRSVPARPGTTTRVLQYV
jgi:hypothetical protein